MVGWKAPMPLWPDWFQSPARGTQLPAPYRKLPASAPPALASLRRYHVAVDGSKTPMPVWPLPCQSPTTGFQPLPPKANVPASGAPAPGSLRR